MRRFNLNIKDESGSTSVLIVVMMIVLTAFGMAALTTAYAGYRLSNKNVEFSQEYYSLEEKATVIEYELLTLASDTRDELLINDNVESEAFQKQYYELLLLKLKDYAKKHEGIMIESSGMIIDSSVAHVNYVVTEEVLKGKSIGVKLDIKAPRSNEADFRDLVEVINRYEWQGGVGGVSEDIFFEDPFENPFEDPFDELDSDDTKSDQDSNPFDELDIDD